MIEAVRKAMVMSAAECAEAQTVLARYAPDQIERALAYTQEHASRPNWPYMRQVLAAKAKRRITMDDYPRFSELTKAKLDRYPHAVTGLETVLPGWLPEYARRAIDGGECHSAGLRLPDGGH